MASRVVGEGESIVVREAIALAAEIAGKSRDAAARRVRACDVDVVQCGSELVLRGRGRHTDQYSIYIDSPCLPRKRCMTFHEIENSHEHKNASESRGVQ